MVAIEWTPWQKEKNVHVTRSGTKTYLLYEF